MLWRILKRHQVIKQKRHQNVSVKCLNEIIWLFIKLYGGVQNGGPRRSPHSKGQNPDWKVKGPMPDMPLLASTLAYISLKKIKLYKFGLNFMHNFPHFLLI